MSNPQNPGGYGGPPPGGGWYPPAGAAPPGGGWAPPGGAPPGGNGPPGGYGPPPGGYGAPPGGYGAPPPGAPGGYGPPPGGFGGPPGGYPPQGFGGAPGGMGGGPKTETLALPTLICGILSIPAMFCCYAGLPLAIAAVVMGIISIGKINSNPQQNEGKGLVIAGMITAGFAIVMLVLLFAFGMAASLMNRRF